MQNEYADPIDYNTVLNPKLWRNDDLKSEVRGALLRMAEDFIKFLEVPVRVLDIVITGGNVNYTYTKNSDIDLHIIADFSSVECEREVAELFDSKRLLYKNKHNLEIYGIPVELYVEDSRIPAKSAGVFSILRDKWLAQPGKTVPGYSEEELEKMIKVWTKILQRAMMTGDLQTCRTAVQLLRTYRRRGLNSPEGEFSIANLVYKSLRNDNVIRGITHLIDRLHDQDLNI